jgi:hypothetical protein
MKIEVHRVTHEYLSVEADSEPEAIRKAKSGGFDSIRKGNVVYSLPSKTLPSTMTQARNLIGAVGKAIVNPTPVSPEEQKRRLSICVKCEFLIDGKKCAKCGCNVSWKSRLEAWHCPIQKW